MALERLRARIEDWLAAEREGLAAWLPVALLSGIGAWFCLPDSSAWIAFIATALGVASLGVVLGDRSGRCCLWFGLLAAAGTALVWARAEHVAAPRLERPRTVAVSGQVLSAQRRVDAAAVRIVLAVDTPGLPPRIRVTVPEPAPPGLEPGARVALTARLMPPPGPVAPGGYDFRRAAWFQQLGATGRAIGPVAVEPVDPNERGIGLDRLRARLTRHVQAAVGGDPGGMAAALVTGDQGGIGERTAQDLRDAGLAHLLSISGLHVAAAIGFAMVATRRLLALSPWLALRLSLTMAGAVAGALAGIGYTLLAGAEVPTVRSCVAALLVLIGLSVGREAITLRTVAAGAMLILLLWPEAAVGASFQLSFAAVLAIVALHEAPAVRRLGRGGDDGWPLRAARSLFMLVLTGLVVEAALLPIGLFHFNKAGLYGAAANIIAIPFTTFVIMPVEALALLADLAGLGAPLWWLLGQAIALLLALARLVAGWPGATALLPAMPTGAFAAMAAGGLWLALWRTRPRWLGLLPMATGATLALAAPPPDVIVTGDGRHLGWRLADGRVALLRDRSGDFTRRALGEAVAARTATGIDGQEGARCSVDLCVLTLVRDGRRWLIAATRSPYLIDRGPFAATCASVDIMVSDRRLPSWCRPRWMKMDRAFLDRSGALAIRLSPPRIDSVAAHDGRHPWAGHQ